MGSLFNCGFILIVWFYYGQLKGVVPSSEGKQWLSNVDNSQGPSFAQEPPNVVEFSNNTKMWVNCVAMGQPTPTVRWHISSGGEVQDVDGLRTLMPNGTLVFHPFAPEDYRQDVHAASYRCQAANSIGTIVSRDVWVRAVVIQKYELQVYDEFVITGNTGVLKCHIPSFVTDYVSVTDWIQEAVHFMRSSPQIVRTGDKYLVLTSGQLHVLNVSHDDGLSTYKCRTYHRLTRETKVSSTGGRLIVTAPQGSVPPRITDSRTTIEVDAGASVFLPCAAQGYPVPVYSWFVKRSFDRWEAFELEKMSLRIRHAGGSLFFQSTIEEDSATYLCLVNNSIGSEKGETNLAVSVPLMVTIQPTRQVVDLDAVAKMHCSVTGYPVNSLVWLRNGQQIDGSVGRTVKSANLNQLRIDVLQRSDVGMYQCFARNSRQTVHGISELRVGDASPELDKSFDTRVVHPGTPVSLFCQALGNPRPQMTWALDDTAIENHSHLKQGYYLGDNGLVISYLNSSSIRSEDGGLYSCTATNRLGSVTHSARINVYGAPYIRPTKTVSVMAAADVTLRCPYSGYPIDAIYWEKDSLKLPLDRRQRVFSNGTMKILNVQASTDAGRYTCVVHGPHSQSSSRDLQVAVLIPPVISPFTFQGDEFVEGMRVRATCFVSKGDLPIAITWTKDGHPLAASNGINVRVLDEYATVLTVDSLNSRHSGNYTCQARNSVAFASYTAQLIVNVSPHWVVEPHDISVNIGGNATFDCMAHGAPQPTITWLKAEGFFPGDYRELTSLNKRYVHFNNGSLLINHLVESDEGEYLCQASNGIGAGLGRVVQLLVNVPPYFEQQHHNYTLSKGQEATLGCTVHGDLPIAVSWLMNGHQLMHTSDQTGLQYNVNEKPISRGVMSMLTVKRHNIHNLAMFTCIANNSFGQNKAFFQLTVQEPPDPPTNLKIMALSSRSVKIAWMPPFNGNTEIFRYSVQYKKTSEVSNETFVSLYVSGAETEVTFHNLLPDTRYQLSISAENRVGLSRPSDILFFKTEQEPPSGSPQSLQVQATDSQTLRITWLPPKMHLLHGEVLGYNIGYRLANSSDVYVFRKMDSSKTDEKMHNFLLTNLKKFSKYLIIVQAFNRHGSGPSSAEVESHTFEDVPSKPPQNIACAGMSSQSLRLNWDSPPEDEINGRLLGFKVIYKSMAKWLVSAALTKITSESYVNLHGLDMNSNYSVQILAFTKAGDGVMSDVILCATEEDVPDAPYDIKVLGMSPDAILVVWLPPEKLNGKLVRYTVYLRTIEKSAEVEVEKHTVVPSRTHFEALSVNSLFLYEVWVTASTSVGEGKSTRVVAQSVSATIPARIASFSQQIVTRWKSNVTLPCRPVGLPQPDVNWKYGFQQLVYSDRYVVLPTGSLVIVSVHSGDIGNYSCSVRNQYGSDRVTYQLSVLAPPAAPRFTVSSVTLNSVHLRWDSVLDGGSPVVGYSLSYRREYGEWEEIQMDMHIRSYRLDSLWCGTKYQLYMTAYSAIGPGKPSDIVSTTTQGSVPLVPRRDVILASDASSVTLSLDDWSGKGCPILYFVIEYKRKESRDWILVSNYVRAQIEPFTVGDLQPNSWYELKVTAHNRAGSTAAVYEFSTGTYIDDDSTSDPTLLTAHGHNDTSYHYLDLGVMLPFILPCVLVLLVVMTTYLFVSHHRPARNNPVDCVNPYATAQVTNVDEEFLECKQLGKYQQQQRGVDQLQQTLLETEKILMVERKQDRHSICNNSSYSCDIVPDVVYHSRGSSTSGDSNFELENVSEAYDRHPVPRHSSNLQYLNSCVGSDDTVAGCLETRVCRPPYLNEHLVVLESDCRTERMLNELKSVIAVGRGSNWLHVRSDDSMPWSSSNSAIGNQKQTII